MMKYKNKLLAIMLNSCKELFLLAHLSSTP